MEAEDEQDVVYNPGTSLEPSTDSDPEVDHISQRALHFAAPQKLENENPINGSPT